MIVCQIMHGNRLEKATRLTFQPGASTQARHMPTVYALLCGMLQQESLCVIVWFVCREYIMPTKATKPGPQTAVASLTKPDADPSNDSSTADIKVEPTCHTAYDASMRCSVGSSFDDGSVNKSLANDTQATFDATCCVSASGQCVPIS